MLLAQQLHVLPRELWLIGLMNLSTFEVGFWLAERFPLWVADKILVFLSWLTLGSTDRYGIRRPREAGPLEHKRNTGRTAVLDVGTIAKVKSGHINVEPTTKFQGTQLL
jgi:indole-3-pyruvate monooxygenase